MENSGNIIPDFTEHNEKIDLSDRLKFWETNDLFSCPISGICLTVQEQKLLIKKAGISLKKLTLFEMHEILVTSAKNENPLSRKVDALLVRKFSRKSKPFASMSEGELTALWRSSFNGGEYVGIFWFLASRRNLSRQFRREIFGDIHMSMHRDSSERAEMLGQMQIIGEERVKMAEKFNEEGVKRKLLQKEILSLQKEVKGLKTHMAGLEKEKSAAETALENTKKQNHYALLEELKKENSKLTMDNLELAGKNSEALKHIKSLEAENKRISGELFHRGESEADFQKEIKGLMALFSGMKSCDRSCPSFDLCKKRVLIVGGISKMESLYRKIVESNGGIFEYHDGYAKGGLNSLEHSFKRADMVLCPVSCNSHAACILVKQLGKKHNKPVQMLSGAGLSAISQGIRTPDSISPSQLLRGSKRI